jgi:hypothetical protein
VEARSSATPRVPLNVFRRIPVLRRLARVPTVEPRGARPGAGSLKARRHALESDYDSVVAEGCQRPNRARVV